jgi:hypothetical protein
MDDTIPFASHGYFLMLGLLVFSRGMDFLSTYIATPNLALEGNPLAKKLGWKWGLLLNVAICLTLAMWPLSAIVISTASVLVAARNFQSAWLMRSLGEETYRRWHVERVRETRVSLYLFCLAGNTLLTGAVGAALIYFSNPERSGFVAFAIGMGMVTYAIAVAFYTLLAIWRIHRAARREARELAAAQNPQPDGQIVAVETCSRPPGQIV